jgi:hypothetical protein
MHLEFECVNSFLESLENPRQDLEGSACLWSHIQLDAHFEQNSVPYCSLFAAISPLNSSEVVAPTDESARICYKPLAVTMIPVEGYDKTYISSSRPWECGDPEGISKECGKGGKPALWLSMLSTLSHFHGLLFARQVLEKPM